MPRLRRTVLLAAGVAIVASTGCSSDGRTLRPARPDQTASVYTTTTSSTEAPPADPPPGAVADVAGLTAPFHDFVLNMPWEQGAAIDPRYTCNGADVQPGFSWSGTPAGAVEMALVVTDVDATNFVHWMIAGLDPAQTFVEENSVPVGAIEGTNGFPADPDSTGGVSPSADIRSAAFDVGWRGPCPPAGTSHVYRFALYALDQPIELPTGSDAADLQAAIDASAIAVADRTGVYSGTG